MLRVMRVVLLASLLLCGCGSDSSREQDVHYTMAYVDGWQRPVPPQATSPFEPQDVTYVDEPLIELDSDWNMDVKLFSKYRYTNEFVERWRAKYGYTPTRPVMADREFFDAIALDHPGLEHVKAAVAAGDFPRARDEYLSYQASRPRPHHLKPVSVSREAGEAAVEEADRIMADPKFPACVPGMKFSLWGLMGYLERTYLYTEDIKYARAWLEMFNHWYVTYRPPQDRPKMYIAFVWMPYWRTLGAAGSARTLCESERWLARASELGLDKEVVFSVYSSILEHAQFLEICNDVFMPSNWQTAQCEGLVRIGAYFPTFRDSRVWRERAWELTQEHMLRETYEDGTHCENSVGYAVGVINQYRNIVRIVRKSTMDIPEGFLNKWKSMYLWATKIVPPTGNYVPCGDNGIGAEGSFVKSVIIKGALEFADPTMKYFAERYPDEVRSTAEDQFENTANALKAYDEIKAEEPPFTSILLPNTGWAVMRHSWDVDSPYMFFDYGWDEAWHAHPDFGSFDIWAHGEPVVTECGRTGSYEADMSKRWYKQTIAHNTVMVDSRSMRKCVNNRLNQWWTSDDYDFADATSDGYRWIGVLHNRRVLFVKPDYWIITDFLPGPGRNGRSFQTSGYHEFDWLAHFQPTQLRIDERTKRIDTTNEGGNVALIPLNASDVEIREHEGPIATPEGMADASYISLHREGMAFVQYQVLLLPYKGSGRPEVDVRRLPPDEVDRVNRQNVGYEITVLGRNDVFLEPGNSKEKVSIGEYVLRGTAAHICDAGKKGERFLLLNADYLARGGKVLFSAPEAIDAIEFAMKMRAGYDSHVLEIATESDVSGMMIYAPGVRKVRVAREEHAFKSLGDYVTLN
ncbi:MAG: alginate lyase family protein [Candidatus Eisenbacteria sp.]|nr:alginate lyase family protein [Candidatus Eisenbacteria bacterium]